MKKLIPVIIMVVSTAIFSGCASSQAPYGGSNAIDKGVAGAVLGGITGAVVGHQSGERDAGAAVGAAVGAASGYAWGNEQDKRLARQQSGGQQVIYQQQPQPQRRVIHRQPPPPRPVIRRDSRWCRDPRGGYVLQRRVVVRQRRW